MSDTKYVKARAFNLYRAMLFGYKPTRIQKLIYLRSDHVHMELQFSDRYGGISFSFTLMDGCNGARFKMIGYEHEEYWDTVMIPVTAEQEEKMFTKACRMAGYNFTYHVTQLIENMAIGSNECLYVSVTHRKYDKAGAGLSYITQYSLWKPHKTKMVCNRGCCEVLLAGIPGIMDVVVTFMPGLYSDPKQADYAQMTPSQALGMLMNYARSNY